MDPRPRQGQFQFRAGTVVLILEVVDQCALVLPLHLQSGIKDHGGMGHHPFQQLQGFIVGT